MDFLKFFFNVLMIVLILIVAIYFIINTVIYLVEKLPIYKELLFKINTTISSNKEQLTYHFNNNSFFREPNRSHSFAQGFLKYCENRCDYNLAINLKIDLSNSLKYVTIKILPGDEKVRKVTYEEE